MIWIIMYWIMSHTLSPGGWLLLEINHLLADETARLITKTGFMDVRIKNDIYEKERFIIAHL